MSTPHVLLGLLSRGPRHGYELKREHDVRFAQAKPLPYGQVYATLGRLLRDGLVEEGEPEAGAGPDRRVYGLTEAGQAALRAWLADVEPQLETVDTWNAESNDHMIAVNEVLGYRWMGREHQYMLHTG